NPFASSPAASAPAPAGAAAVIAAPSLPGAAAVVPTVSPPVGNANLGEVAPIWRFKCEDEVRGTPLLTAGMIVVGAYDNNLYGIGTDDGQLKWKYATDGGLPGS